MEALQKGRARADGVATSHDGRASLQGGVAVGLIKTTTVGFITVRFRHCGKLPQLRGRVTSVEFRARCLQCKKDWIVLELIHDYGEAEDVV